MADRYISKAKAAAMLRIKFGNQKLQLHARLVEFEHPFTGKKVTVKADPPFHMSQYLELFRSKEV